MFDESGLARRLSFSPTDKPKADWKIPSIGFDYSRRLFDSGKKVA